MEFEFIHNCSASDLKSQVQYALDDGWEIINITADQGSGYSVALQRPKDDTTFSVEYAVSQIE